jgi:hypothetical protein
MLYDHLLQVNLYDFASVLSPIKKIVHISVQRQLNNQTVPSVHICTVKGRMHWKLIKESNLNINFIKGKS